MKTYSERIEKSYEKAKAYKARKRRIYAALSVCASLIIAFNLILFAPYTIYPALQADLSAYKGGEYYGIAQKLSEAVYGQPRRTNNFTEWFGGFNKTGGEIATSPEAQPPAASGGDSAASDGNGYHEVTDNQVAGVTEGDLFKRTDKNIFYLNCKDDGANLELQTFTIAKELSQQAGSCTITPENGAYYAGNPEMYLSADGKTVTVFGTVYDVDKHIYYTEAVNIDVTNVTAPKITNRIYVSGSYLSSRLVNGEFLLITDFRVNRNSDFSDSTQVIPQTGDADGGDNIPADRIICPDKPDSAKYTVVCTLNGGSLEIDGRYAFMSYSDTVYVSQKSIFITRPYYVTDSLTEYDEEIASIDFYGGRTGYGRTEISRIDYDAELDYVSSVSVKGTVLNQYSMDVYEGVLRVVTTVNDGVRSSSASIYCIDAETFDVLGSLERFAPDGETVRSVRFDKETAYVCTAKYVTDPVFVFNLSDPQNITFKDTGDIPGFSIALRQFYGGTLLGIGYDEAFNLKIELYREEENGVNSVAVWISGEGQLEFSGNYKAYLIDADNGYIGLCVNEFNYTTRKSTKRYILLKFDGENLTLINTVEFETTEVNYHHTRACIIDGYLYVLNGVEPKFIAVNG